MLVSMEASSTEASDEPLTQFSLLDAANIMRWCTLTALHSASALNE